MLHDGVSTGYKVVTYGGRGNYTSSIVIAGEGAVNYPFMRWVTPQVGCGPLAVFGDRGSAITFAQQCCGYGTYVFLCEFIPSRETGVWYPYGSKVIRAKLCQLPAETILAAAVKLVREV